MGEFVGTVGGTLYGLDLDFQDHGYDDCAVARVDLREMVLRDPTDIYEDHVDHFGSAEQVDAVAKDLYGQLCGGCSSYTAAHAVYGPADDWMDINQPADQPFFANTIDWTRCCRLSWLCCW